MYEIFCDGATSGNGKADAPGGWAYVILSDGIPMLSDSGGERGTTNQRMELTAALRACEAIEAIDPFATVKLYSDSAYLIRCFKENWWKNWRANGWKNSKKEPVANQDLWEKLIYFFMKAPGYEFVKVKGHAGNEYNEIVDKMAVHAKEEYM
jgi:ribonuclease HI